MSKLIRLKFTFGSTATHVGGWGWGLHKNSLYRFNYLYIDDKEYRQIHFHLIRQVPNHALRPPLKYGQW